MEKKIYCLIGERCKRITFSSLVHDGLIEINNNDSLLQSMINNKIIILQKVDCGRNKFCDIEEDEEIHDKKLKYLLFEKSNLVVKRVLGLTCAGDFTQKKKQIKTVNLTDIKVLK
ncbi:hypothetical protein ALC60_07923 [Trachymyrmex zeteki]|uniref:Uncharacterized protein n=1 Tax=Mycetomoellerius zeteki TaxID=64791 RepID=A0A151WZ71_9HYME|nr:hypothetical protein ALC60_07923 [Trachymyrmex zeteki]